MVNKVKVLLTCIAGVIFCAQSSVMAGQVGTTPEGNVIYEFICPGATAVPSAHLSVDWENHMGSRPEWEIGSGANDAIAPEIEGHLEREIRNGQHLKCVYDILENGHPGMGRVEYRYKVKRHIISCQDIARGWRCVLKDNEPGGQSSSSATSNEPAAPCIGLGCETQPNPTGCIGRGCGEDRQKPTKP